LSLLLLWNAGESRRFLFPVDFGSFGVEAICASEPANYEQGFSVDGGCSNPFSKFF
jgi:hypothetical protein